MIQCFRKRRTLQALAVTFLVRGSGRGLAADDTRLAQSSTPSQERTAMWMTVGGTHRFAMTDPDR